MKVSENINFTFILYSIALVLCLTFIKYVWSRRWFFYYAFKIPGPFSSSIIGTSYTFLLQRKDIYQIMLDIAKTQPPVFKVWFGPNLCVFISNPHDLEIILSKCINRGDFFRFGSPLSRDGLLTSYPATWGPHRKVINMTFNSNTLHSFIGSFNKHAKKLVQTLQDLCDLNSVDIFFYIFCRAIDTSCETLFDIDASLIDGQENYIKNIKKVEKLISNRPKNILYHNDYIWKCSSKGRELEAASDELFDYAKKIIDIKKSQFNSKENLSRNKRFLNYLLNKSECDFDDKSIIEETQTMLVGSSETSSLQISMTLLILGIYPEIQEKVYEEIMTVVGNSHDITLDHVNKMTYLDAVIKESMRSCPTVPLTLRETSEDIKLSEYIIPAGAIIFIPISFMQKLPKYWKNPNEFNPDRFLSKEVLDLPPCVFMPFSYGRRNCIGYKFGLLNMKIILGTLLRHYKFESVYYKSIEEIEYFYPVVFVPKKGFKVRFQKRKLV